MKKLNPLAIFLTTPLLLTGCGSSDSDSPTEPESGNSNTSSLSAVSHGNNSSHGNTGEASSESAPQTSSSAASAGENTTDKLNIITNLDTGSVDQPQTIYFDLETNQKITLTDEEATENKDWDIAFKRTDVYLNNNGLNNGDETTQVKAYYMGNADNLYENGQAIDNKFDLDAEDTLAAFEAITASTIPDDATFIGDEIASAIDNFYIYNPATRVVTANKENHFIVRTEKSSAEGTYAQFNITEITTVGRNIGTISFNIAYQAAGQVLFAESQVLTVNAVTCTEDIFIDLDSQQITANNDLWDLKMTCLAPGGADFSLTLSGDADALHSEAAKDAVTEGGIDPASAGFQPWRTNQYRIPAIANHGPQGSTYGWGEYGLFNSRLLWPNFATFIIQTPQGLYKWQITSYYNTGTNASGSYSFRYQGL